MYRIVRPAAADWERFVRQHPRAHVLQMPAWGALKAAWGWQVVRIGLTPPDSEELVAGAQMLLRPLGRVGKLAYLPMGPLLGARDQWDALWPALHRRAGRSRAFMLKWEPGHDPDYTVQQLDAWRFRASDHHIQPPRSLLIDLRQDEDGLLARMNQGTRRKIRLAHKRGVRCRLGLAADLPAFTQLMSQTGERNAFGVHEPDYYRRAFDLFVPRGHAALWLAEHEGQLLAGVMVFRAGRQAWYLYGASASHKRNLMASHAAQWAAIRWAKDQGCLRYDLWGVPDAARVTLEASFQTRRDGLWGVYGFKRGWGGELCRSAGAFDHVYNPLLHRLYRVALALRRHGQALD
ncbi:MAG: peptidoglycan bridge formation glycyltransferase FemA/FemB family protein [Anaerolineaceae bacterium]|nr:peptidoglycan bridge formation glycyltransferase FemA/FemB family protein [Anaerolineaceae bacterium]